MPTPLPAPYFVAASSSAAALVGLDVAALAQDDFVAAFTGNAVPARAKPLSAVYSGHQFGVWAGQLGDGRAILLGQLDTPAGPMELQLKGAGLTLDYGPFGFMEAFDSQHICNHTDQQGRYSYANQPDVGHWNCHKLGQALLPLIGAVDDAQEALDVYQSAFAAKIDELLHAKLGLDVALPEDGQLFAAMFALLDRHHVDFTQFFRKLGMLQLELPALDAPVRDLFIERDAFDAWAVTYRARLRHEHRTDSERRRAMDAVNPKYVLRNYLAQVAIDKANNKDFSEVATLLAVLEHPFDEQHDNEAYAALPPDWASHLEVSCSS